MSEVAFQTMGRAGDGGEVRSIGVGMLGYAFMAKAHSHAYRTLSYMAWPPPLVPNLVHVELFDNSGPDEQVTHRD